MKDVPLMNRRLQRTQLSLAVAAACAAGWPLAPGLLVTVAHANPGGSLAGLVARWCEDGRQVTALSGE